MIQEFILYKRALQTGQPPSFRFGGRLTGAHRLVIPRLVLFANLQWAAWQSLTWLTFALQSIHIALLCVLSWALVGRRSRWLFALSVVAILNLMFSPAQLENFVWSIQFMFPLVHVAESLASYVWRFTTFRRKSEDLSLVFSFTRRSKACKVEQTRGCQTAPNITQRQCFCPSAGIRRLEDQYRRGHKALVRPGRRLSTRRMKILDLGAHFCAGK
jgi:hypothetical protein